MAPDSVPGTRPTVLETLAVTGGTPKASRVGKVMSVPEPTTVLIVPAAHPASRIATTSNGVTSCGGRGRLGRRLVGRRRGGCLLCRGRRERVVACVALGVVARVGGVLRLRDGGLHRLVGLRQLAVEPATEGGGLGRAVVDTVADAAGLLRDPGHLVDRRAQALERLGDLAGDDPDLVGVTLRDP